VRSLSVLYIFVSLGLAIPLNPTWYPLPSLAAGVDENQNNPQPMPDIRVNRPILRTGSQGTEVSELQAALRLLGYYTGKVDGVYSESTANAVSQFQKAAGLNPDGIVGSDTWNQLFPATATSTGTSSFSPTTNSAASFPIPTTRVVSTNPKPQATTVSTSRAVNRQAITAIVPRTYNRQTTQHSTPQAQSTSDSSLQSDLPTLRLGSQGSAVTLLQKRLRNLGLFKGKVTGVFDETTQTAVKAAQQRFKLAQDGVAGPATWNVLLR
jgi:peptidoglycan hydrolase-like protein with peptidoglycan-binding domain